MLNIFLDAKHRPATASGDAAGLDNATSGSATDRLTREHRMTLDEAHLILNVKQGEEIETVLKVCQLFLTCFQARVLQCPKPIFLPSSRLLDVLKLTNISF